MKSKFSFLERRGRSYATNAEYCRFMRARFLPHEASQPLLGTGTGRSTTAAWLDRLDYELIANDILPVSFNHQSLPGAWPYLRRSKLQMDTINQLGLMPTEQVSAESLDLVTS